MLQESFSANIQNVLSGDFEGVLLHTIASEYLRQYETRPLQANSY